MATYNVHAGHNLAGKIACGASGLLDESKENRLVKGELINYLRQKGNTVYDCTEDNGKSQRDVLEKIVAKCNAHTVMITMEMANRLELKFILVQIIKVNVRLHREFQIV